MKAPNFIAHIQLHLFFLLLLGLTSCSKEQFTPVDSGTPPSLQALKGDSGDQADNKLFGPACSGTRTFSVPYNILPPATYSGYQWAVQLLTANASPINEVPENCICKINRYCITIEFPQEFISQAAIVSIVDQEPTVTQVDIDGKGGYITPQYNFARSGGTPQVHRMCLTPSDLLIALFQLPFGFPPEFNPKNSIVTVSGICTVDNLPTQGLDKAETSF